MHVCHVIDRISQTTAGGSAKACYQLAAEQARQGHAVTIVATDKEVTPYGVRFVEIGHFDVGRYRAVWGAMSQYVEGFDIFHLHNYRTDINLFVAAYGYPFVLSAYGSACPLRSRFSPLHRGLWRRAIMRKARRLIAVSDAEIGQYVAEGANEADVTVIPVGIDLAEFDNLPVRGPLKSVLYLGRLHESKGIDVLIRAWGLVVGKAGGEWPEYHLRIVGNDDGYERQLKQLVDDLGIGARVHFPGPLYGIEKVQAYRDASVTVIPSRYEMQGIVPLESLACGTPVVMSDKCELARTLPSYCGRVAELNPERLAWAIGQYLLNGHSDESPQRIEWARQYGWEGIAKKVQKVYEEAIG